MLYAGCAKDVFEALHAIASEKRRSFAYIFTLLCNALCRMYNLCSYVIINDSMMRPFVSKSNNGLLVFNAFIDKEYAPRGRHAPLITRYRTTWRSRRQWLANPLIGPLVILVYWEQVWTGRWDVIVDRSLAQGKLRLSSCPVRPAGRGLILQCPLATISIHQDYRYTCTRE